MSDILVERSLAFPWSCVPSWAGAVPCTAVLYTPASHLYSHFSSPSRVICLAVIDPYNTELVVTPPQETRSQFGRAMRARSGRAFEPPAGDSDQQLQQQTTGGLNSVMLEIRSAEVNLEK